MDQVTIIIFSHLAREMVTQILVLLCMYLVDLFVIARVVFHHFEEIGLD